MHIFPKIHNVLLLSLNIALVPMALASPVLASACPESALSQLRTHRAGAGESLDAVAAQYGLQPSTLVMANPSLPTQGALPPGQAVAVPPFNGTVVQVSHNQTWQSLAERHETRADLLFEVNGCPEKLPTQVFIPGGNSRIAAVVPVSLSYPLPAPAPVVLSYGWQPHPQRDELIFNSGIALATSSETGVIAAADGTVAFVGDYNGAAMVIINHRDGVQTRYGNLANSDVEVGSVVTQGDTLGTVAGDPRSSFVYFEVRTNSEEGWVARDPGQYLSELDLQQ